MQRALAGAGSSLAGVLAGTWRWSLFAAGALASALTPATYTRPVRVAVARQLCLATLDILPGVLLVCALFGLVLSRIVFTVAHDFGLGPYATELFVRGLVIEIIPLFVALFLALRSGAAFATEVALARAGGAPEAPAQEVLARGIGISLSVLVLTALACFVALVVGYVGLYGLSPWGHAAYSRTVGHVFAPVVMAGFLLKLFFFAVVTGAMPVSASLAPVRGRHFVALAAPRGLVRVFVSLALVEAASLAFKYA